ncbi:MAG: translation elongation factor-like protein [Candidatus Bathyarchaeia archaeon]
MGLAENLVGRVINYFSKISVAAINLNEGDLKLGDRIRIRGSTTDLTQTVDSMQINKVPVTIAEKGSSVGIKVQDRVRPGDEVYKILE